MSRPPKTITKLLIANRGEIAIRVMRAATELGIATVAAFTDEDKLSLHRFKADQAFRIGEGMGPVKAYLSIPEYLRIAELSGADGVHPGYEHQGRVPVVVHFRHEVGSDNGEQPGADVAAHVHGGEDGGHALPTIFDGLGIATHSADVAAKDAGAQ